MRIFLVCFVMMMGLQNGAWAMDPGLSCQGQAVSQSELLAKFPHGTTRVSLGKIVSKAYSRQCASLSGCSEWSSQDVQLSFNFSDLASYARVVSPNPVYVPRGYGSVSMPEFSEASLVLNRNQIELHTQLGKSVNSAPSPQLDALVASFDSATAAVVKTLGNQFQSNQFEIYIPSAQQASGRDDWGSYTVVGRWYGMGRLDVNGVSEVESLSSLTWSKDCFEAVYLKRGEARADGSYTEAQIHMNASF